jgi:hypothetical protein
MKALRTESPVFAKLAKARCDPPEIPNRRNFTSELAPQDDWKKFANFADWPVHLRTFPLFQGMRCACWFGLSGSMLANTQSTGLGLLAEMASADARHARNSFGRPLHFRACDNVQLLAAADLGGLRLESWAVRATDSSVTIAVYAVAMLAQGERIAAQGRFTFSTHLQSTGKHHP